MKLFTTGFDFEGVNTEATGTEGKGLFVEFS